MTAPSSTAARIEQLAAFGRDRHSLNESVWYNGSLLTFLASSRDTQGQFALIELVGTKGNVPPPHIHHRESEAFYILEGEITASVGGQTIKGGPGSFIFLPRDVQHSFVVESERLRMLVLLAPAGFEGYFKECSVPAPAMTLPPQAEAPQAEIQKMMTVAAKYGLEFVLPEEDNAT
jgi:quercetin dioxygenase-like cupin family protein